MDFNKEYTHYKAADFATDELFRAFVLGNDPKVHAFWRYWSLENPNKVPELEHARRLLEDVWANQADISEEEINDELEKIQIRINTPSVKKMETTRFSFYKRRFIMGIAASLVLMSAVGFWFYHQKIGSNTEGGALTDFVYSDKQEKTKGTANILETTNTHRQPLVVTLNDSSKVTLEQGSKLKYPDNFDADKREVTLEGEAFFEITKNPSKPFLVHARGVMTKVLGTSFRIKAFDKNVKVLVKTGKVAVFTQNEGKEKETESEKQAIVLTPNQQVTYETASNRFNKSVQEVPVLLVKDIKIKDLYFDDAPVATVLNALKDAYGIDIIFDEDILQNCYITTSLTDEPLFEKLTIICKTIGATYRELDAKIIVTGRGCR
ncbi:MAG: FecR family protein [Saprospiraceae bacterium]|nr:FecR family protein [Saprospiraceae bacterium]